MSRITCLYVLMTLGLVMTPAWAETNPSEVKERLQAVEKKLASIERDISNHKKSLSSEEKKLAGIDMALQSHIKQQETLEDKFKALQEKKKKINLLLAQLKNSEQKNIKALERYLQSKQKQSVYEPLKLMIQQSSMQELRKTAALYRYFVLSQAQTVQSIKKNLQEYLNQKVKLAQTEQDIEALKAQLEQEQQSLAAKKKDQLQAISGFQKNLASDVLMQQQLNKQHQELNQLLEQIQIAIHQGYFTHEKNFAKMVGKLQLPIATPDAHLKSMYAAQSKETYIPAPTGTQVHAVFPGRVVFSDWLRGLGLLMIIDHGQGYMSLYGNNQVLYKSTGDWVQAGEQISRVGQSGGLSEPGLYFEIRKDGKSLDPNHWIRKG